MELKYHFTQLSAPITGLGVMLFLLALTGKYHIVETDHINHLDIIIISVIFLTIPVAMGVWGKIQVSLGVLNRCEAEGNFWSKPWEKIGTMFDPQLGAGEIDGQTIARCPRLS